MGLDKYLSCKSSLEAYLWISNMTLNNNLGLKLYVMLITYYMIIISGNQELVRRSSNEVVKTVAKTVVV